MRQLVRWMGRVLPPRAWMLSAVAALATLDAMAIVLGAEKGHLDFEEGQPWRLLPEAHWKVIAYLLCAYGVWRSMGFHPAFDKSYRQWLLATPWVPSKPLPRGPVSLTWQDAAVVLTMSLSCIGFAGWQLLPVAFFAPYCLMLSWANLRTGQDAAVLLATATVVPALGFIERPPVVLAFFLGAAVICWIGFRRSLPDFPWDDHPRWRLFDRLTTSRQPQLHGRWPRVHSSILSDELGPLPTWKALAVAALGGWLAAWIAEATAFGAVQFGSELQVQKLSTATWFIAILGAGIRVLIYCALHWAPISLAGRLVTMRPLIPRYDVAFAAPVLAVVLSSRAPFWLYAVATPLPLNAFLSVFVVLAVLLGMGPTLRWWHLVGEHRLAFLQPKPRRQAFRAQA